METIERPTEKPVADSTEDKDQAFRRCIACGRQTRWGNYVIAWPRDEPDQVVALHKGRCLSSTLMSRPELLWDNLFAGDEDSGTSNNKR